MHAPRDLRAWALVVALLAAIPLVAYAAGAQSAEPAPPTAEPTPQPATRPSSPPDGSYARVGLALDTNEVSLEPGARAIVGYRVHNDGDETVTVRVESSGLSSDEPQVLARFRLAPGDVFRGRLHLTGPADGGFHLVRVEAIVEAERGMSSLAFLHVSAPLRFLPAPEPFLLPTLPTTELVFQPIGEPMLRPCEPRTIDAGEEILLRLALKGKIVDGQLVIDLDPELLAVLSQ